MRADPPEETVVALGTGRSGRGRVINEEMRVSVTGNGTRSRALLRGMGRVVQIPSVFPDLSSHRVLECHHAVHHLAVHLAAEIRILQIGAREARIRQVGTLAGRGD